MLFIAFSIDAGRYLNAHSNATEVTQAATRARAQTGGQMTVSELNSEFGPIFSDNHPISFSSHPDSAMNQCTNNAPYISVVGDAEYKSFFGQLTNAIGFGAWNMDTEWGITAVATARCEVVIR